MGAKEGYRSIMQSFQYSQRCTANMILCVQVLMCHPETKRCKRRSLFIVTRGGRSPPPRLLKVQPCCSHQPRDATVLLLVI